MEAGKAIENAASLQWHAFRRSWQLKNIEKKLYIQIKLSYLLCYYNNNKYSDITKLVRILNTLQCLN